MKETRLFGLLFYLEQLLELLVVVEGREVLHDDGDGECEDQHARHGTGHADLIIRKGNLSLTN